MKSISLASLLTVMVVSASGCSTTRDPEIRVLGATIADRSAEAMRIELDVEITNRSDESLRLEEFDYRVIVNGRASTPAIRSAQATLAPRDVRLMRLPAVILLERSETSDGTEAQLATVNVMGSVSYIAPGQLARAMRDLGFPNPRARMSGKPEVRWQKSEIRGQKSEVRSQIAEATSDL